MLCCVALSSFHPPPPYKSSGVLLQGQLALHGNGHRRSVKAPDGKTHYLPCSPGEAGATAATLATLAENGLAENVRPGLV